MKKTLLFAAVLVLFSAFAEPLKKYIVTVCVEKTVYAPCPYSSQKDGFGRVLPNDCSQVHFMKQYDTLRFEFEDSLQGQNFYLQAFEQIGAVPADTTLGVINYVDFRVRIDSLSGQ